MKLTKQEINKKLKQFSGWKFENGSISKTFKFVNFMTAMNFVNNVAAIAQIDNHHPNIDIRYSRIIISLSTHDEGGVTEKDISLAEIIEKL